MKTALQVLEALLFLASFFGILALLIMLPVAMFAPAR
jgi:hypothetical protein